MDEERALLAAIAATPGDDGPREVYADWLQARDDPRFAYLQIDAALARDPSLDRWAALVDARRSVDPAWVDQVARCYDVILTDVPVGFQLGPLMRLVWALVPGRRRGGQPLPSRESPDKREPRTPSSDSSRPLEVGSEHDIPKPSRRRFSHVATY